MAAMVFPQTPAPEAAGPTKERRSPRESDGSDDSGFEAVSRKERERLDRESTRVERRKEEAANADAKQQAKAPDRPTEKTGADSTKTDAGAVAEAETAADAEAVSDLESDASVPFTFADLQKLVQNPQGAAVDGDVDTPTVPRLTPASGQGLPGMPGVPGLPGASAMNGLPGMNGPGESGGKPLPGQTASQMMADLMAANNGGDGAKTLDPALSFSAARASASAELANQTSQSLTSLAGQKGAEQGLALKGYATSIDVPVGHAEWGDKLVGKLTWLTARNLSVAEIHITPPDMGPLDVRVQVQQDQATVTVHSANQVVRDQLELNSHRLRDMLGEQGIDLDQFEVMDSPDRQPGHPDSEEGESAAGGSGGALASEDGGDADDDLLPGSAGAVDLSWRGELDLYA